MADEADIDRAVEAARAALDGDWGRTPPTERSRLLHALADALVANRKELAELEVRNVGKALSSVKAELSQAVGELPLLRLGDRLHRRPLEPAGRLAPLLLAEGARRRRRADRALELPADDDDVEAGARAGRRLHDRAQAGLADAADGAPDGRARDRGRVPAGSDQRRARPGDDGRPPTSCSTRASTRSRSPAPRRRARRSCETPPTASSGSRSSWAARARTSSSPTPTWPTRSRARPGRSTTRPARAARRARGSSSSSPPYDDFVAKFTEAANGLKVGDPLDNETQVGSLISPEHRDRVHGYVETGPRGRRGGRGRRRVAGRQGRVLSADGSRAASTRR